MARRLANVLEEERVGEERWIYTSTLRVSVYIHHYSPPLWGIVVYYTKVGAMKAPTSPSFRRPCITEHKSLYMIQILHVVELRIYLH